MNTLRRITLLVLFLLSPFAAFAASSSSITAAAGASSSSQLIVQEEGAPLTARSNLNFIGSPVTCVDNAGTTTTDCTITNSTTAVQEEGGALTSRSTLNFIGGSTTCADNAGSTRTDCTSTAPYILSVSGIPFIKASTFTMGNNGAISAMTALSRTYSNGAYIWLPPGGIQASGPQIPLTVGGWYWFVASSTTAGTVYNSTYTSGTPHVGTTTAFSTTGPGAGIVGDTATVNAVSITLPGGSMGVNGRVEFQSTYTVNNTGGNKVVTTKFGATACFQATWTTHLSAMASCTMTNRGLTTAQGGAWHYATGSGSSNGSVIATDGSETTASNVTLTFTVNSAVATDHAVLETYRILVVPGS